MQGSEFVVQLNVIVRGAVRPHLLAKVEGGWNVLIRQKTSTGAIGKDVEFFSRVEVAYISYTYVVRNCVCIRV